MSTPRAPINNKRLLYSVSVTVSLLLVFLGVRVPYIFGAHSPKPHSRVVIETAAKDSQDEGSRKNLDDAVCQNSIKPDIPTQFIVSSHQPG